MESHLLLMYYSLKQYTLTNCYSLPLPKVGGARGDGATGGVVDLDGRSCGEEPSSFSRSVAEVLALISYGETS